MNSVTYYDSPIGRLLLAADEEGLCGVWIEGQKYYARGLKAEKSQEDRESRKNQKQILILRQAVSWLDAYFTGGPLPELPAVHLKGTPFQNLVWQILAEIPYGTTITYKEMAMETARRLGRKTMSAQAVGNAIGKNPLMILYPCHRVIGADRSLTGYAGGLEHKIWLLEHEGLQAGVDFKRPDTSRRQNPAEKL